MSIKLLTSEDADPNYLACVVKCPNVDDHPNADRLSIVEVFGNTIVVEKGQYVKGETLVYFPVESSISRKFLSWANLYESPSLNSDGVTKSYFTSSGRVKAVRLRQIPSQGFLFKIENLARYYNCKVSDFTLGTSFDIVDKDVLVTKYIRQESKSNSLNVKKVKIPNWVNVLVGKLPRPIRKSVYIPIRWYYSVNPDVGIKHQIVNGQFKFHYSTEHLGKNIFMLKPDDDITITSKWHGTSFIAGNLLCKKRLPWYKKLLPNTVYNEYKLIYASRHTLKNRRDGVYTDDVWSKHAKALEGLIPEGITLYGEIVGWSNNGRHVQKNYTYGVKPGESELRVYRLTDTDKLGQVNEYGWPSIEAFCRSIGYKTVPVYYVGKAKDVFPLLIVDDDWSKNFLDALKVKYLDKPCEFTNTGIVNEGIVLKINNRLYKPVYKFKSPEFLVMESKSRDSGEENLDEEN